MFDLVPARSEVPRRPRGPHSPRRQPQPSNPPKPANDAAGSRPRYAEFDTLRATALFAVVALHAALAYTRFDIPRLLWGVRQPSSHIGFDLFAWWQMGFSMPLFFTISGFFAAAIYGSKGPRGYVENRVKRIVVPFFAGGAVLLPLCFCAWAYGWFVTNRCTLREIRRMRFFDSAIEPSLYGPAHLWFLEYLIVMLAGYYVIRRLVASYNLGSFDAARLGRILRSPWTPLALALPATLILRISRDLYGIEVSFDRHNSFLISPIRLLHYSLFFGTGLAIHHARASLDGLAPRGLVYLALLIPLFAIRVVLLRQDLSEPLFEPQAFLLSLSGGLFSWLAVLGAIGTARRYFSQPSRVARYLADRSYWIYLVHMPLVGLIQANLVPLPWPNLAKFAVALCATFTIGLTSYHIFAQKRKVKSPLGLETTADGPANSVPAAAPVLC